MDSIYMLHIHLVGHDPWAELYPTRRAALEASAETFQAYDRHALESVADRVGIPAGLPIPSWPTEDLEEVVNDFEFEDPYPVRWHEIIEIPPSHPALKALKGD